jgi:oligopeptide transport system ATP-binding protein
MQIIFQDPYASLNPRMTVGAIVGEALIIHKLRRAAPSSRRASSSCSRRWASRRPHAPLSARVLGRAAAADRHRPGARVDPKLIVCDEPVSALDVSIQAQVINLLEDLQASSASPTSSSPTTSRWSSTSATASP